jgi:glycosyltransferase involved in cell wall biosynthesis
MTVLWTAVSQPVDLVHAHWALPAGLYGALLAAVRRKPLVVTSHGAFTNTFEQRNVIVRWLVRLVLSRADKIIAVGNDQQQKIEAAANLPAGSVACINMGLLIPDSIPSQQAARRRLNLPQDTQIVLFIGNLLKRKGPDLLVSAAAELGKMPTLQIFIGGHGPESGPLAKQIQDLNLEKTIELIGPVEPEEVLTWMAAADICVVPSRTEPFGLVAIESLAAGTPVIAAEVGGLIESIQPGYNGLLFAVDDHKALAAALNSLLANPSLRQQMSLVANKSIKQYDMRLQAEKVLEIYEAVKT